MRRRSKNSASCRDARVKTSRRAGSCSERWRSGSDCGSARRSSKSRSRALLATRWTKFAKVFRKRFAAGAGYCAASSNQAKFAAAIQWKSKRSRAPRTPASKSPLPAPIELAAHHTRTQGAIMASETKNSRKPLVGIVMGSDTDLPVMSESAKMLEKFEVPYEIEVTSAHRSPARTHEYASTAVARGLKVVIVAAGGAAHLAGVIAAVTTLPGVAVPMATTVLSGIDSLLSSVQMPAGVPVAAMAIDKAGAINAAIFAAEILATSDQEIAQRLTTYKEELARSVADKNLRVKQQFAGKAS